MRLADIHVYGGILKSKCFVRPNRHQGMNFLQYMKRNELLLVNVKRPQTLIQHCNSYLDRTGWLVLPAKASTLDIYNFQRQMKNWFRCWFLIAEGVK